MDTELFQNFINATAEVTNVVDVFNLPFDVIMGSAIMSSTYALTSTLGILFMAIYYFIDLEELALRNQFNIEHFIRNTIKFIIAIIIVNNIGALLQGFNTFVCAIVDDIPGFQEVALSPVAKQGQNMLTSFEHHPQPLSTIIAGSGQGLYLVLLFLLNILTRVILWTVSIKRAIDIGVYYALSPMVCADVFSNGVTGSVRKMKRMLAAYMQLPFVVIIMKSGSLIISKITSTNALSMSVFYITALILFAVNKTVARSKGELETIFSS